MTETKKRIKAYQAALPALRERVVAMALLLVMSATMMVSASFAWVTLSRAPEVSGAATQIAANGNLEIALAGVYDEEGNLVEPLNSAVGDSSATQGQTIVAANLTWGNLVNLSDPSYGLDQIVLRPAALNRAALSSNPFRSAIYGEDGRVVNSNYNEFSYCMWEAATSGAVAHFAVSDKYGVRAVSTVTSKYEADMEGTSKEDLEDVIYFDKLMSVADDAQTDVHMMYPDDLLNAKNSQNKPYMDDLCAVMGLFLTKKFNPSYPDMWNVSCNAYLESLLGMYKMFYKIMYEEIEAMAEMANAQQFIHTQKDSYTVLTADALLTKTAAQLKEDLGVTLTNYDSFIADYRQIETDMAQMQEYYDQAFDEVNPQVILFERIEGLVNSLVTINTCWIHSGSTSMQVKDVGSMETALSLIGDGMEVEILEGLLARFEERTGAYVKGTYSVTVSIRRELLGSLRTIDYPATATVYTVHRVEQNNLFQDDKEATQERFDNSPLNKGNLIQTAGDTYGLAIDMWVRTNATGDDGNATTYLTLEGQLLYNVAKGTDADGNKVGELFYYEVTDETTNTTTKHYVYRKDNVFYNQGTNDSVGDLAGTKLTQVYEDAPVGFEGENRVWEEWQQAQLTPELSEYNTTQGSGSCFTFYADSPTEQQAILNLLSHMYVVFTDGGDTYLSTAGFDTSENHYYSVGGKVTVPLQVMDSDSRYIDESGNSVQAVTTLRRNQATRITALVYLDGSTLSNKEALSATDIKGTLNIQFGNSADLKTLGDKSLQEAERVVSATVTTSKEGNVFNFFEDTDFTASVKVSVSGDVPGVVRAFFQREINSTQGSREEEMVFTPNGDGTFSATYTFTAPGNYVLRSVQLDGVDYELSEPQRVTVKGFKVSNLAVNYGGALVNESEKTIITPSSSVSMNLSMSIAADSSTVSATPKSVQLIFLRSDATAIAVDMRQNGNYWTGDVSLNSSGVYTLSSAVVDGEYYDLGSDAKKFTLYIGMVADVYIQEGTPTQVLFKDDYTSTELGIRVRIRDNVGNYLNDLENVQLHYKCNTAGNPGLDAYHLANEANTQGLENNGGFYDGKFINVNDKIPGIYTFDYVKVGTNVINVAGQAPTFYVRTITPVAYRGCVNKGTIFAMAGVKTAYMNINIRNSATADYLLAYFNDMEEPVRVDNTELTTSTAEGSDVTTWFIPLPADDKGNQEGTWTLKKIEMCGVSDDRDQFYGIQEDGTTTLYTIDVENATVDSGKEAVITVISKFHVDVYGTNQNFGVDENNNVTGLFMDSYTKNDFTMEIYYLTDEDDSTTKTPIPEDVINKINTVTVTMTHRGVTSMMKYGHYEGEVPEPIVINLKEGTTDAEKTVFVQSKDATFQVAGEYVLTDVTMNVGSTNCDNLINIVDTVTVTVSSKQPEVRVSAVSSHGSNIIVYEGEGNSGTKHTGKFVYKSDYYATVYITHGSIESYDVTNPSVTLRLYDMPENTTNAGHSYSATMVFANETATTTYTFDKDNLTPRNDIGSSEDGWALGAATVTPAGVRTTDFLTVTYNSATYTVYLTEEVTINNPKYPPYVDFVVDDTTFVKNGGTVPSRVYSMNGETITFDPLIAPANWSYPDAQAASEVQESDYKRTGVVTPDTGYYITKGSFFSTTYYNATLTYYQEQAVKTGTSWTAVKQIEKWTINGTDYTAGEPVTISVSGANQAVAKVKSWKENEVTVTTYYTRDYITYTEGSQVTGGKNIYNLTQNKENITSSIGSYPMYTEAVVSTDENE